MAGLKVVWKSNIRYFIDLSKCRNVDGRNVSGILHNDYIKSCQEGVIGVSGNELRLYDGLVAERLLDLDRVQDLDRRRR